MRSLLLCVEILRKFLGQLMDYSSLHWIPKPDVGFKRYEERYDVKLASLRLRKNLKGLTMGLPASHALVCFLNSAPHSHPFPFSVFLIVFPVYTHLYFILPSSNEITLCFLHVFRIKSLVPKNVEPTKFLSSQNLYIHKILKSTKSSNHYILEFTKD